MTANVNYAKVLESIRPLEQEQSKLHSKLQTANQRIKQLNTGVVDVDKAVSELKEQLNTYTKESAEIEIRLGKAQETISAAEGLLEKLNDEFERWKTQVRTLITS